MSPKVKPLFWKIEKLWVCLTYVWGGLYNYMSKPVGASKNKKVNMLVYHLGLKKIWRESVVFVSLQIQTQVHFVISSSSNSKGNPILCSYLSLERRFLHQTTVNSNRFVSSGS